MPHSRNCYRVHFAGSFDMPMQPTSVPSLCFDAHDFEARHRLDALNEFSRGLYCYAPLDDSESSLGLRLKAWNVGAVAAASFSYKPMDVLAPNKVASSFQDRVFLRAVKSGHIKVKSGDRAQIFGPGSIFLMDVHNHLAPQDDGASLSLRLPFSDVGYDPYRHGCLITVDTDGWLGRMLSTTLDVLFEKLPEMSSSETDMAVDQISSLVRAILQGETGACQCAPTLAEARALTMRRFIDQNLHRADLGVDVLMAEFHAARATVYRAFDDVGGVSAYIREKRLAAIYRDLQSAAPSRGAIRYISERHGFPESRTFFRAFRSRYGFRPSDVIGTSPDPVPATSAGDSSLGCPSLADFWVT